MLIKTFVEVAFLIAVCSGVPYGGRLLKDDLPWQVDSNNWDDKKQNDDIMGNGPNDLGVGCGGKPADIYFAFDASEEVTTELLNQQTYYASELVRLFYLKQNTMRIGAFSYGSRVRLQFRLGTYTDINDIKASIGKISNVGGRRSTDKAMKYLHQIGFSREEARQDVGQIVIMFTTGSSSNIRSTQQQANALHRKGVYIYVIGIGNNVNENEIRKIASRPSRKFVFDTVDYAIGDSLVEFLRIQVCDDQPSRESQNSKACIANRPVDVIFAVDEVSIGARNSRQILYLIEKLVQDMDNSTGFINIGLLNSRNINFGQLKRGYENISNFLKKLQDIRIPDNSEMLRRARRMAHRGREDTQKTLVIFYDENVDITKRTIEEAIRNKFNNKMEIYVVSVGNTDRHAMSSVSSKPINTHLVNVPDYQVLQGRHREILDLICTGW